MTKRPISKRSVWWFRRRFIALEFREVHDRIDNVEEDYFEDIFRELEDRIETLETWRSS